MKGRTGEPAIEIVSIRWERVQLTFDVRPVGETAIDPGSLRLSKVGGRASLPPTRVSPVGDQLAIRINVMQGPDLQPLETGRWRLVARSRPDAAARPLRIVDASAVDPDRDGAAFQLRGGVFRVTPLAMAGDGTLALEVAFEPGPGFDVDAGRLARARQRSSRPLGAVRGAIFHVLLRGIKVVASRSGRRVLFTSDSRAELTGNLKDVHDRMVERGLDRDYRLVTLFRESVARRRSLIDRLRLPWLLASADVIVVDDFQPIIYRMGGDPDVRIIQLWHASGAFKTVGYSRVGKPGGPDPYSRVHKNYTHAIVSSDHDVPFYAEAFGIPEARVVPTGIPRMDRFFDEAARAAGLEAARAAFPETAGRTTILFAPTFRGEGPKTATYDLAGLDYAALHALCVERDAAVIIRMHPFVTEPLAIPDAFRDRLLDGSTMSIDVNDLLFAVDLLITDYSSIVFEYSTLGRPMLFYAYDLEDYVASRDFYVPFESFVPGRIVRTFTDMLDAIRREDYEVEKVGAFATRHFAHLDGGSTDRVIDELILPAAIGMILTIRILLVRLGFFASRPFPLRSRVVLATAHAAVLGGNLAILRDELAGRQPAVEVVTLAHRPEAGLRGRVAAAWQAIVAGHYLATSRTFIVDDYFFPIYVIRPRRGTTIIQTWHASGAFKKVGYSVLDKSFGVDEALASRVRIHSNYDVCLVASQASAPHYAEAFRQPLERFVSRYGIPRTDVLFGEERLTRTREAVRRRYGLTGDGRRVILYAPTFRGDSVTDAHATDDLDLAVLHETLGRDHVLLVRLHPFVRSRTTIGPDLAGFAIDVSDHPDINELMLVSDILITDYSSAIYEYSLLGHPMVFFAPDYEAYELERGFYFDYRTGVPGPIFETTGPLAEYLRAGVFDTARVERFREASFDVADGHSATYVTDALILPSLTRAGDRR